MYPAHGSFKGMLTLLPFAVTEATASTIAHLVPWQVAPYNQAHVTESLRAIYLSQHASAFPMLSQAWL